MERVWTTDENGQSVYCEIDENGKPVPEPEGEDENDDENAEKFKPHFPKGKR